MIAWSRTTSRHSIGCGACEGALVLEYINKKNEFFSMRNMLCENMLFLSFRKSCSIRTFGIIAEPS